MDRATTAKPRNVLMVTVVQARGLPIADKAMLIGKGSSDPFVTLTLTKPNTLTEPATEPDTKPGTAAEPGTKRGAEPGAKERGRSNQTPMGKASEVSELACVKTTVKKRNLSPVWKEKVNAG